MKNEEYVGDTSGENPSPGADQIGALSLTDWAKEPKVMDLKSDLSACQSSHDSHVANVRRWTDMRNIKGPYKPKKTKGRSQLQPKLIRRQNEWRYSALSEPFLSSDKLFDAEPRTWEDEKAAKQNETLLNWQIDTKLNKVTFIDEYVRTAVDEGTVIVRVGWERETVEREEEVPVWDYVELTTEEELAQFNQYLELRSNNPREFQELPEDVQASVAYALENELPVRAIQPIDPETGELMTEIVVNEVVLVNEPTWTIVEAENIFIDPSCEGDVEKAKFVIYSFQTTQAELKKSGRYKNLDKVNWSGNSVLAQPDHKSETPDDFQLNDELRKPVVAYEYWGWYDVDGTGELKAISATWIGDTMIHMGENPFPDEKPPFVVVPYMPIKKSVYGEPDAEILEDNQAVLGAITRGMIDLMGRSANSQTGTAKGFLDVTNRRRFERGDDYEFNPGNGDPRLSVYQHVYPEIPNSALTMLNLQNSEAESISGVKAFSGGLSGEAYGEVAAGIKGVLDAASKREMSILRRLVKGIIQIGAKMASMNAVFLSEKEVIRVTNTEFVEIRREDLKGNFDLKIEINTPEIDEAKATDLGFMLQTMGPNLGFPMVQMILSEIADLKRMPALARRIREFQPQEDPVEAKTKELEVLKLEMEIEEMRAEVAVKRARANHLQAQADQATLDFVEEETGTKHAREMEKAGAQAKANQDLEVTKALLTPPKPEEVRPNVEAAVGYNRLSAQLP